jgi:predicted nucleic acid-binding protein
MNGNCVSSLRGCGGRRRLPLNSGPIAGQAKARKLTLVTHNTTEFQRVSGLRVEDWTGTTSPTPAAFKSQKSSAKPRSG